MVASELPRLIVVGAGSIGERHVRCFLATGRVQVDFVEPRPDLREEIAGRYPEATPFANLEEALGQPTDALVIATPAPLHVAQARMGLERGCHVLIEKPLAITDEGVAELLAMAEASSRAVGVAYVYRAHPALAAMRTAIASGEFGKPLQLVAVCGQHFPFYRPAYASTYYARHETGGGAVQDALTHILNAGEWLMGPVTALVADTAHQRLATPDVEDTAHVIARHGEAMASYALNQHQAPNETTITVVCESGTARFEYHAQRWRSCRNPGDDWTDHAGTPLERDTLFIRQADAFLDACLENVPVLCSLHEGIGSLRVNQAILKSVATRRWQDLPNQGG